MPRIGSHRRLAPFQLVGSNEPWLIDHSRGIFQEKEGGEAFLGHLRGTLKLPETHHYALIRREISPFFAEKGS